MEYTYKAMRPNGETFEGTFVAETEREVVEMLKGNNNYPIHIEERQLVGTREVAFAKGVGSKDLTMFCRQLAAMLRAGSTITRSLDIMKRQLTNKRLKEAVSTMHSDVQKGIVLSESMAKYPKIFPTLMVYMIESGEVSGTLDVILERLATYFEKDAKLKNKVKSAMVYPIVLITVSIGVVFFLVNFILPTFVSMFESGGVDLPGVTKALLAISEFTRNNGILLFMMFILVVLALVQYVRSDSGRRQVDSLKLRLPVLRDLNTKILTARFSRNLSTLLSSGVPLLTALKNLADIINNQVVADAILTYREEIQKGNELHQLIREGGLFPPMLDGMMEIGKESGTLDEILEKTADYYDDEVEHALQRLVTLFEPAMILILAFIVGFIVIAMVTPMFDMFQTIKG